MWSNALSLKLVLRKRPQGKVLDNTAHDMRREFKIISALNGHIPVPQPYIYCDDVSIIGTEFYLMKFVNGRVYVDTRLVGVANKRSYWYEAVRVLALLHKVPFSVKANHINFYQRQVQVLKQVSLKQAAIAGTPPIPRLDQILEWFQENFHKVPEYTTVIHGDYKLDNVVFDDKKPVILAVLDWELSTVGSPFSDLANLLLPFYMKGDFGEMHGLRDYSYHDLPRVNELVSRYAELSGHAISSEGWKFCIAFSFFRTAVILQGVAARKILGQASSAKADLYASLMKPAANYCREVINSSEISKL